MHRNLYGHPYGRDEVHIRDAGHRRRGAKWLMPNAIESLEEEGRKSLKQSSRIIIISLAECQFIALDSFEPFPLLTDKSEKLMADTEILRINTLNNSLHRQIIFCPSDIRGALNID